MLRGRAAPCCAPRASRSTATRTTTGGSSSWAPCAPAVSTVWSQSAYRALRAQLRERHYDIVHVHNFFPLISPAVYYAAQAEGCSVVQTLHNYRLSCPAAIFYRDGQVCEDCLGKAVPWPGVLHGCYRGSRAGTATVAAMLAGHRLIGTWRSKVDLYIALNEFMRQKAIAGGLPAERIVVKPNFVGHDPGVGDGRGGFALFTARLNPEKGVPELLAAWRRLGAAHPAQDHGRRAADRRRQGGRGDHAGHRVRRPAAARRVLRDARPGELLHLHLDLVRGLPAGDQRVLRPRHADRRLGDRADRRSGRRSAAPACISGRATSTIWSPR